MLCWIQQSAAVSSCYMGSNIQCIYNLTKSRSAAAPASMLEHDGASKPGMARGTRRPVVWSPNAGVKWLGIQPLPSIWILHCSIPQLPLPVLHGLLACMLSASP